MSPLMRLVLGIAALLAILAAVSIALPGHVSVSRSVVINAPESAVYPYLNTMRNFSDWAPWRIRDPNLQMTFSGPAQGKGAHVDWVSGSGSIGTGSMEIVDGDPNRSIDLAVNFNGVEGTSAYTLVPSGSGSKLSWSFSYDTGINPLKRWRGVMLDNLIGPDYSAGLNKLKANIEETRRPMAPATAPGATLPGQLPAHGQTETTVPLAPAPTAQPAPQAAPAQQTAPAEPAPPAPEPRPQRQQR
ncbi:MAG: SRPBCC family protein [Alphaproteobacteria bacterium]|nr:SRPBCC family protein [Alphaproteobacteria bacterium]